MKLIFLTLIMVLLIPFSYSNGIWTYPEDIKSGVFGAREGLGGDDNYTFNNIVYFNRNIFANESINVTGDVIANRFISRINSDYVLEPSKVSNLHRLVVDRIFSLGSNAFYLDPANTSILNDLTINGVLLYKGEDIDSRHVNRAGDTMTGDLNIGLGNQLRVDTIAPVPGKSNIQVTGTLNLDGNNIRNVSFLHMQGDITNANSIWANNWIRASTGVGTNRVHTNQICNEAGLNCVNTNSLNSIPTCSGANQALGWDGSNWICNTVTAGGGGSTLDLVNGLHSSAQCTAIGGTVVGDGSGNSFCRFNQATCPSGWLQYQNWRTTSSRTCQASSIDEGPCGPCTTGSDPWQNNPSRPTCTYRRAIPTKGEGSTDACEGTSVASGVCTAIISQIGCY